MLWVGRGVLRFRVGRSVIVLWERHGVTGLRVGYSNLVAFL